jgi:hypothetical protein
MRFPVRRLWNLYDPCILPVGPSDMAPTVRAARDDDGLGSVIVYLDITAKLYLAVFPVLKLYAGEDVTLA